MNKQKVKHAFVPVPDDVYVVLKARKQRTGVPITRQLAMLVLESRIPEELQRMNILDQTLEKTEVVETENSKDQFTML